MVRLLQRSHPDQEKAKDNGKVLGFFKGDRQDELKEDAILWKAFLSDSKEAFSEIFLKYNPKLITIGIKLGFDRKLVEDCIQDLFLNLWTKRQQLGEVHSVMYYLLVSLRRSLLHHKEKKIKALKLLSGIHAEQSIMQMPEWLEDGINKARLEVLFKQIEHLPKRQLQALTLRYIDEKPYPEIAGIMCVDINSARKFVHKAVKGLKVLVSGEIKIE